MGRKPSRPRTPLRGVFSVEEARTAGLERWHLEGAGWARVGPSQYVCSDLAKGTVASMGLHGSTSSHRGIQNLRRVLSLAEPATESPMESRLRMVLVLGGLPRPRAQVSIRDRFGRVIGRPDLFYERERIGIEYDGGIHRDKLVEDNRRQNRLLNAGVRLLRFTASDVLGNPDWVVQTVKEAFAKPASAGSRGIGDGSFPASAGTRGKSSN